MHFRTKILLNLTAVSFAAAAIVGCGSGSARPFSTSTSALLPPSSGTTDPSVGTGSTSGAPGTSTNTGGGAPAPAPAPAATPAPAPASATGLPSGAQSFNNIEQMGGWQSCSECAGKNAHGPKAQFSMNQHQKSPSLDGNSTVFHIGGKKPYSDAIWWRNLGPVGKASHFVFDLNFYIQNPGVSEGLEFDINVAQGGRYYVFGNQCSPLSSQTWDTWDMNKGTWNSTGIACNTFPANQWNHVTIEVERSSNNQLHWVSITYNGSKHYVDRYVSSQKTGFADGASIDFQMDGNFRQDAYSTWLDKVSLSYY